MVLKKLRKLWTKYPDLRFCQLIGNCFPSGDNYNRTDLELLKSLFDTYKNIESAEKNGHFIQWAYLTIDTKDYKETEKCRIKSKK
jgi:hypothetical protein